MARVEANLKLGYYPLPPEQGPLLRACLDFPAGPIHALDPCCGEGRAILALTGGAQATIHGVELDARRAATSQRAGIKTIQGNAFDVRARVERFSFLYLNPPYDFECGPTMTRRMESQFLRHTFRWLQVKGVLLMVIPLTAVHECIVTLSQEFTDLALFKLAGEESEKYKQVAIFGVRHRNTRSQADSWQRFLNGRLFNPPVLTEDVDVSYKVPSTILEPEIAYAGLPLDLIEDRLPTSAAWNGAGPMLLPKTKVTSGRPLTPLHGGHIAVLATAGMLDGIFGSGEDRHITNWRTVKLETETTEVDGEFVIQKKRERFASELAMVYADGRTLIVGESERKTEQSGGSEQDNNVPALAA